MGLGDPPSSSELFPQLAKSLPPEEAEFLHRQFVLELERIEKLLAA